MSATRKPGPDEIKAVYDFALELRTIMYQCKFDIPSIKTVLTRNHFLEQYQKRIPAIKMDLGALPKVYSTTAEIDPLTYFMHDSQEVIPKAIRFLLDTTINYKRVRSGSASYEDVPINRYTEETSIIYRQLARIMRRTKGLMQDAQEAKTATKLTAEEMKERQHPHDKKLTYAQINENIRTFELLLQALQQVTKGKALDSRTERAIINCKIHFEASRTENYFLVKQYKAIILQMSSKEHKQTESETTLMMETLQGFLTEFREKPALLYKSMNEQINSLLDKALAEIHAHCVKFHATYSGSSHMLQRKSKTQQKVAQLDLLARMSSSLTWQTLTNFNRTVNTMIESYVAEHKIGLFGRSKKFTMDDFNRSKSSHTTAMHLRILQNRTTILMAYREILSAPLDIDQTKNLLARIEKDQENENLLLSQLKPWQVDNSFSKFLSKLSVVLSDMCDYLTQYSVKEDKRIRGQDFIR